MDSTLGSDDQQKIAEVEGAPVESRCKKEVEELCCKTYSAEKLKRDEFASQFLTLEIREKLLNTAGQTSHKIIAAR